MASLYQKLLISVFSLLLFVIVSLPEMYKLTNKIFGRWKPTCDSKGCPTTYGFFIHSIVFFLLVLGSMFVPWGKLVGNK
jgi:hypothetical protein